MLSTASILRWGTVAQDVGPEVGMRSSVHELPAVGAVVVPYDPQRSAYGLGHAGKA